MLKNKYLVLSIILISVFSLTGCSMKSENSSSSLNDKVNSEVDYLDEQLLGMLNKLNNISLQRYIVVSEKITNDSATSSTGENEQMSSGGESGGSNSSGQDSSDSSQSSAQEEGGDSDSSKLDSNSTSMKYGMKSNNILSRTDSVNWEEFNTDIENLYDTWSTITVDLYKQGVNNNMVLNFSSDLQTTLNSIKTQDKNTSLENLSKLYSYIPEFSTSSNGDGLKTNVLKTKSSLVSAYSLVEQDKWEEIQIKLNNTEQNYMPILNDIISNSNKEYNINKAYILIKEMQSSAIDKNKDSFYINYRNLLQELDVIQG